MLLHLDHAFGRTIQARAWALLAAVAGLAPQLAPRELAEWVASQIPGAPAWASWGVSVIIVVYRLWTASKAVAAATSAPSAEGEA